MNAFRGLLLCLVLALLGALAWQQLASDQGQVIVSLHGTVYVTTVSKALLLLALALAGCGLLLLLLRLPLQLWRKHRHAQALTRMTGGLIALHEGRWSRAEKLLAQAAAHAPFRLPARLAAAHAAQARGDAAASEQHLAASSAEADHPAAALVRAQAALDAGQAGEAISILDAAAQKAAPLPRAVLLHMRALLAAGRAGEAWGMFGALRNARVLTDAALAALEEECARLALEQAADASVLADFRDRLPAGLRSRPGIVAAYAARAQDLGLHDAAAAAIQTALAQQWDEALALRYGRIPPGRDTPATARLQAAQRWLPGHPDSPALALTLGRLSADLQQWGMAEDHLQRALTLGAGADGWECLGEVHAASGDPEAALQCLRNALRAARGESVVTLSGRSVRERIGVAAVVEQRDANGVPRLPSGPA